MWDPNDWDDDYEPPSLLEQFWFAVCLVAVIAIGCGIALGIKWLSTLI